jgi:hypothetical protein
MAPDLATKTDKPNDPPHPGGEDEQPTDRDPRDSGEDVKEPPLPGTAGRSQKFPRPGNA